MAKPELRDHRKFIKLRRLLGAPTPHVLGYLDCLWTRGYQTGDPLIGDSDDVEAAAEFQGERGAFTKAARDAGFIDQNEEGKFSIHDLYDHAPGYAKRRMHRVGTAPDDVRWESISDGKTLHGSPNGRRKRETSTKRTTKPKAEIVNTPLPPATGGVPADEPCSEVVNPEPFEELVAEWNAAGCCNRRA